MQYSTPSRFLKALNAEQQQFPTRSDVDVFPFQGIDFPWWTGFYISHPDYKRFFHVANSHWRAAQQLHSAVRMINYEEQAARLDVMWRVIGALDLWC